MLAIRGARLSRSIIRATSSFYCTLPVSKNDTNTKNSYNEPSIYGGNVLLNKSHGLYTVFISNSFKVKL